MSCDLSLFASLFRFHLHFPPRSSIRSINRLSLLVPLSVTPQYRPIRHWRSPARVPQLLRPRALGGRGISGTTVEICGVWTCSEEELNFCNFSNVKSVYSFSKNALLEFDRGKTNKPCARRVDDISTSLEEMKYCRISEIWSRLFLLMWYCPEKMISIWESFENVIWMSRLSFEQYYDRC